MAERVLDIVAEDPQEQHVAAEVEDVAVQEPVYRVEVQLESQQIRAFNNNVPLQSGMLLSADIVLEQRSLMVWLFEPILSLKGRL